MNNELLLLIKKQTDMLIDRTNTKPQELLEFKTNKQMQTFSFNPPINLVEEGKWLLAVTSLKQRTLFLISLMETIASQLLHQVTGIMNLPKKNY